MTVSTARRFGSAADFTASLKQPLFTTETTLTAPAAVGGVAQVVTSTPVATASWPKAVASKTIGWTGGAITGAIPGQVVAFVFPA